MADEKQDHRKELLIALAALAGIEMLDHGNALGDLSDKILAEVNAGRTEGEGADQTVTVKVRRNEAGGILFGMELIRQTAVLLAKNAGIEVPTKGSAPAKDKPAEPADPVDPVTSDLSKQFAEMPSDWMEKL